MSLYLEAFVECDGDHGERVRLPTARVLIKLAEIDASGVDPQIGRADLPDGWIRGRLDKRGGKPFVYLCPVCAAANRAKSDPG